MTERERQQEKEIERLQRRVKMLSEAYERVSGELEKVKKENGEPRKKGRPAVDDLTKEKVLGLYRQGHTMREIARKEGIAAGTVHKIVSGAVKESRAVYVYANKEEPATIIDACALNQKVKIVNLTDDMLSRAFGIKEQPDWEDFEAFLESRCMPRTKYGIREELSYMGIDAYDPVLILQETSGRVHGDHQYLRKMKKDWVETYDEVMKRTKNCSEQREHLLKFLHESEGAWKLNEGEY